MRNPAFTLRTLADAVGASVEGDGEVVVRRVGTLEDAAEDAITFLADRRLRGHLEATHAAAVILSPADIGCTARPRMVHANPYLTYARVAWLLHPPVRPAPGVSAQAAVDPSARVDPGATVGPFVVIGARSVIGPGCIIAAGACIGEDVSLGQDVVVQAQAVIHAGSVLGDRTVVYSGAVIGADGFGMANDNGRWVRIPQVGRVVIGTDCEIGANTTIDRGAIGDTVLEEGVKLDNQIQVAHNCRIGAHTAIAGCVGIAGSVTIGRHCRIGGAAMISGHLSIADGTVVSGGTLVAKSIEAPGIYTGSFPALPHRDWQHAASGLRRLRGLAARVSTLERRGRAEAGDKGEV